MRMGRFSKWHEVEVEPAASALNFSLRGPLKFIREAEKV
jgi:hypothetical protein